MTRNRVQKFVSYLIFLLAAVMIVVGILGVSGRSGATGQANLTAMQTRAVLNAAGEGAVEAYVALAKSEATKAAKEAGGGMAEIRAAVEKAEAETRAQAQTSLVDYAAVDEEALHAPIADLENALKAYYTEEAAAQAKYLEENASAATDDAAAEAEIEAAADTTDLTSESGEMSDELPAEEEAAPDLSGFVATEEMNALRAKADEAYAALGAALKNVYTALDDSALNTLQSAIENVICQGANEDYATRYDRYAENNGKDALESPFKAMLIRNGDDIVTLGVALAILGLLILFYKTLVKKLGIPRLIIGMFFVVLCVMAVLYDLSLPTLLSNTIVRFGMNAVLVLAMMPGIQCGISLNLGLPVGILGGLLAGIMSIEFNIRYGLGFWFSIALGSIFAIILGYLYGLLLNKLKGSEMAVTTYVGYSFVSLSCIAWILLPFTSLELRWPLGMGLRNTFTLGGTYRHYLDNFLKFKIGSLTIPTGLLLFVFACCAMVWLFSRSKTGVAMRAAGSNPRFAEATGVNVDKMRIIGTVLSTVLGAIGILVYSQSYGFMQIYTAPRQMGFVAASAVLIGGASTTNCKISHVIIGTLLFQGVLTLGMPVANVLVPQSTISETMRILISNGIILYALTKSGGETRA